MSSHHVHVGSFNEPARETESPAGKYLQETVTRNEVSGEKEVGARNTEKTKEN